MIRVGLALLASIMLLQPGIARADLGGGLNWLARGQYGNAYRELKEAADTGDIVAARTLGWMLERGMVVQGGQTLQARPQEAADWYRKAAVAGDTHSCEMLGVLYMSGRGVPQDFEESMRWFAKAGHDPAPQWVEKFPVEDRAAIAAWARAVNVALGRERKYPMGARTRNSWGDVPLVFDAGSGTVKAVAGDAILILIQASEEFGRKALEVAPPPEAARRHKVRIEQTLAYQLGP